MAKTKEEIREESKKRYPKRKEYFKRYMREVYNKKPRVKEYARFKQIEYKYKITKETYEYLIESQESKCAICNKPLESENSKNIHVDHNHINGEIRGILCHNCNALLGMAKEDTKILTSAINYLDKWDREKRINREILNDYLSYKKKCLIYASSLPLPKK